MSELEWTGERLVTSLDSDYFIFEHLHRYAIAQKLAAGKIVLDIACGEGYGSYLLSKTAMQVYGVDIDVKSVEHAAAKYQPGANNLQYKVGSTSNIPLDNKTIDVVFSFETIEHHDEHEKMMQEIKRVLKPGGVLVVSSPNKPLYRTIVPNNPFHVKELTLDEFKTLIENNFTYADFYEQRFVAGSLITPLQKKADSFSVYDGSYEEIKQDLGEEAYYNKAYYYMAVCSNEPINDVTILSLFNGVKALTKQNRHAYDKGRKDISSSTSYRLGNWFVSKAFFLKKKTLKK